MYDLKTIINYRQKLLFDADERPDLQKALSEQCSKDPVFFINGFIWANNPRRPPYHFPYYLYPKQKELVESVSYDLDNGIGSLTEKSRDWGATYLFLAVFLHRFLFRDNFEALLLSLREDEVDNPTISSMFGKIRYMASRLPFWLMPLKWNWRRDGDRFLRFVNPDNGNTIVGQATTEDAGRSGRKSAVLVDEAAAISNRIAEGMERSLRYVTDCVFRLSTPRGINLFKKIRDKNICKVYTCHWTQIPDKCIGLYYIDEKGNRHECEDLPYSRRSPYGFYIDNKGKTTSFRLRSIWYDKEDCEKVSQRDLDQEVNIRYHGSGYCRFAADMLEEKSAAVRDGVRGRLELVPGVKIQDCRGKEDIVFIESADGQDFDLEIWEFPREPAFLNRSILGVDTAEGKEHGDYCSADMIMKNIRGDNLKHVAALHGHWTPDVYAYKLALLGYYYDNGAFMVVERNKDGLGVLLNLQNTIGYNNLYCDEKGDLGHYTTDVKKHLITGDLDEALRNNEVESESLNHFTELSTYENKNGKLGATGTNNDDRVISFSLSVFGAKQVGRPALAAEKRSKPIRTLRTDTRNY